jgi:hypothetical protein
MAALCRVGLCYEYSSGVAFGLLNGAYPNAVFKDKAKGTRSSGRVVLPLIKVRLATRQLCHPHSEHHYFSLLCGPGPPPIGI